MGIPIFINTDAHMVEQLDLAVYGVYVARRAWLKPEQVLSTWEPNRLLKWLRTPKADRKYI
ncbi:MAG: hypothetical protein GYA12_15455 [Chloroflexi bacterium]|nr:hypothetical protein [Chloroflexota bacterium]